MASPVVAKPPGPRVIADDLPGTTFSKSVYELPQRKNVIQIDVPVSKTKTIESSYDPRLVLAPDTKQVMHGLNQDVEKKAFLQIKSAPTTAPVVKKEVAKPVEHSEATKEAVSKTGASEALEAARKVEEKAKKLTEGIVVPNPKMEIKLAFTNKEEKPSLYLGKEKKAENK